MALTGCGLGLGGLRSDLRPLGLRRRRRDEAAGGGALGQAHVEVGRARRARVAEHAARRRPTSPRRRVGVAEDEHRAVAQRRASGRAWPSVDAR